MNSRKHFEDVPDAVRARMRRIKSKDTKPELILRSLLWAAGYRYRLHAKDLPGRPDLVFSKRRKVIFVHGCFWHQHDGCPRSHVPRSRLDYWKPKLERNRVRDAAHLAAIESAGWAWDVVWECELRHPEAVRERLRHFLGPTMATTLRNISTPNSNAR